MMTVAMEGARVNLVDDLVEKIDTYLDEKNERSLHQLAKKSVSPISLCAELRKKKLSHQTLKHA